MWRKYYSLVSWTYFGFSSLQTATRPTDYNLQIFYGPHLLISHTRGFTTMYTVNIIQVRVLKFTWPVSYDSQYYNCTSNDSFHLVLTVRFCRRVIIGRTINLLKHNQRCPIPIRPSTYTHSTFDIELV